MFAVLFYLERDARRARQSLGEIARLGGVAGWHELGGNPPPTRGVARWTEAVSNHYRSHVDYVEFTRRPIGVAALQVIERAGPIDTLKLMNCALDAQRFEGRLPVGRYLDLEGSTGVNALLERVDSGHVVELILAGTDADDDTCATVAKMKQLRVLSLRNTSVTDLGVEHLLELTQLEEIELGETQVTAKSMTVLKAMPRLTRADLADTEVDEVYQK